MQLEFLNCVLVVFVFVFYKFDVEIKNNSDAVWKYTLFLFATHDQILEVLEPVMKLFVINLSAMQYIKLTFKYWNNPSSNGGRFDFKIR